jgi:hypothetical protein
MAHSIASAPQIFMVSMNFTSKNQGVTQKFKLYANNPIVKDKTGNLNLAGKL